MNQSEFTANRLREVLLDGQWIANTNYKDQILGISWEQATQKIGDLNTIAALTFHINYYLGGILDFFDRGVLDINDKYSFDHPAIKSEEDWQKLVSEFLGNAEKLVNLVGKLSDAQLGESFADEKYGTYLRNMEGVIEHSYYHLGQISLIKKLVLAIRE